MSLSENENKFQYTVTSATDTFDFPYKYWDSSDLIVSVLDNTTGSIVPLDINAGDYTVTPTNGDPDLGASIVTAVSYDDHTITIERIVPFESSAEFEIGDGIPPESLNNGFDKGAAQSQQLNDKISRSVTHPSSDPDGLLYEAPSVAGRASKALGYDASGNVVALDLASSGTISADNSKGVEINSNIISTKVDDSSTEHDGSGNISVKDSGISTAKLADESVTLAKMADVATSKIIGNMTGATATPTTVDVIDDDSMAAASDTNLPTAESIKAYIDAQIATNGAGDLANTTEFESAELAIPTADVEVTSAHGLGGVPRWSQCVIRCTTAEFGYAIDDEIILANSDGEGGRSNTYWANATVCGWIRIELNDIQIASRNGTNRQKITIASWRLVFRAWK